MQKTPIVCLDNNDYSLLSDPRRRTNELDEIRHQLLDFAKSGSVIFAFAGTHLMEMAPMEARYAAEAAARADFLVDLCGRNALVSHDRILHAELARAAGLDGQPFAALSTEARWFPQFDGSLLPVRTTGDFVEDLKGMLKEQFPTRAQRREAERRAFKKGRPRGALREFLATRADNPDLDEVLRAYPMLPEDAAILSRYVLGHASHEEAEAAFINALRDPRWMMRWFAENHETMTPFGRWLRKPSENYIAAIGPSIAAVQEMRQIEKATGSSLSIAALTGAGWKALQDTSLLAIANRILCEVHPNCDPITDVRVVAENCPGLTTAVRTVLGAAWDSFGVQPRPPKPSDFADGLHAIYAPYVTIFRADSYMAPRIAKLVKSCGTEVVGKLGELPARIKEALPH